jgi:hypothetical protein
MGIKFDRNSLASGAHRLRAGFEIASIGCEEEVKHGVARLATFVGKSSTAAANGCWF